MSAFLHSDLHTLVVAHELVRRGITTAGAVEVAMLLRDANNRALLARYKDEPVPLDRIGDLKPTPRTDRQANTMARSFAYQCSEGDVMETHRAAPLLRRLIEVTGGEEVQTVQSCWSV